MSGAFLSLVSGWWSRLFSWADSSRTQVAAPVPEPAPVIPVELPRKRPAHFPAVARPVTMPTAEEREAAQAAAALSLAETLGLAALPAAVVRVRVADPKVRERTLAALQNLQQIPALQSLAQGF